MRVLVLSDIHANLAALEAVIEDAAAIGFDKVWCLGDTVGYGPEPDACVARLRGLDATVVVGNHDWAAIGRMDVDEFNPEAGRAVLWTQAHLKPAQPDMAEESARRAAGRRGFHADPRQSARSGLGVHPAPG